MTTTVEVKAPGYAGKRAVVLVNDGRKGDWHKVAALGPGQTYTTVAHDGQAVCVVEMTEDEYATSYPEG